MPITDFVSFIISSFVDPNGEGTDFISISFALFDVFQNFIHGNGYIYSLMTIKTSKVNIHIFMLKLNQTELRNKSARPYKINSTNYTIFFVSKF